MNIDKKFLLVCLQLIIVLFMSLKVEGMPSLTESSRSIPQQSYPKDREHRNERAYRLYNQCASKEVLILDKVSATANESDYRGDLVLETTMKGDEIRIRIRGRDSGKYLCYNRRGKLVAKSQKKARGPRCEFLERPGQLYWSYMSAHNRNWFLGFDHKGRPLLGSDHVLTDRPNCFKFAKNGRVVEGLLSDYYRPPSFDISHHNRKIGQTIPHLRPDFFSKVKTRISHSLQQQQQNQSSINNWSSGAGGTSLLNPPSPIVYVYNKPKNNKESSLIVATTTTIATPIQKIDTIINGRILKKPQQHPHRHHRGQAGSRHPSSKQRNHKKSQRNHRKSSTTTTSLPKIISALADR